MPRRYPAPNYLPARYLGLIVIAERDPENKRKKKEEEETEEAERDVKLRGYPAAPKIIGDSRLRQWRSAFAPASELCARWKFD